MVTTVPSLEGSLYLTDPQSIVAYQLRKYYRTPKDTIPILSDMIISLPWQVARFGREPDVLCQNMQSDLQGVFDRVFNQERAVTVSVTHTSTGSGEYDINTSVMYTMISGDVDQGGMTVSIDKNGRLVIPEDKIDFRQSSL